MESNGTVLSHLPKLSDKFITPAAGPVDAKDICGTTESHVCGSKLVALYGFNAEMCSIMVLPDGQLGLSQHGRRDATIPTHAWQPIERIEPRKKREDH